jgi:hypothetical protein
MIGGRKSLKSRDPETSKVHNLSFLAFQCFSFSEDEPMNPINDPAQLTLLLTMFVGQLPILLVSLVGCMLMLGRWNEGSRAAGWALAGFGLSLALCVFVPVGQVLVQKWVMSGGGGIVQRAWAFTLMGFVWSVLRAVSLGCLLFALLNRDQKSEV